MTFNQLHMTMLKNLLSFCEDNNCIINSINNQAGNKEYDICLTWVEPRHDGSKCQKLPIEEVSAPTHDLPSVTTDPMILRIDADSAEVVHDCRDKKVSEHLVDVKSFMDLKKGDHVLYYGQALKERHGEKAAVKAAYRDDNVVVRFLSDDVTTSTGVAKLKKVVY